MIKISIREIPSKGLDIEQSVPLEAIGLSSEEVDIRSQINVKAHVEKVDDVIMADTRLKAEFGYICARCLKELSTPQERRYHFDFEMSQGQEYVDLGEEIRQELIMANPPKILCKDDCKGICPGCGVDLNLAECSCKKVNTQRTFLK